LPIPLLIASLLLTVTGDAQHESPRESMQKAPFGWELVSEGDDSDFYLSRSLIENNRGFREYWLLVNHKTLQADETRSAFIQQQIDCSARSLRFLNLRLFSGPMGTGVLRKDIRGSMDWIQFDRASRAGSVASFICTHFA
jgi:hypothetical protein